MQQPNKRNTEKFPVQLLTTSTISSERNAPLSLRRREPRAGAAQQLSVLVCGQLAPSGDLAVVTRRRPLAPPMYVYGVPVR